MYSMVTTLNKAVLYACKLLRQEILSALTTEKYVRCWQY